MNKIFNKIFDNLNTAIEVGYIPCAEIVVGNRKSILYHEVIGHKCLYPKSVEIVKGDIFDLSSLTKPIATATSIWKLIENKELHLDDSIYDILSIKKNILDKEIKIFHLLTHTSGLKPYLDLRYIDNFFNCYNIDNLINLIISTESKDKPGTKFTYSCSGYVLLGCIVNKITKLPLNKFVDSFLIKPLKMNSTFFNPSIKYSHRIVPTEIVNGTVLKGIVHDPLARAIGGISGNAGIFSNGKDLSIFARMLLNEGKYGNTRIFKSDTIKKMIKIYPGLEIYGRSAGWDLCSDYNSPKGEYFTSLSFGHCGYTGTSIWIDPVLNIFIILLTNRVHPYDIGNINWLRRNLSNIIGEYFSD